jgi:hypothetical protein
MPSNPPIVKHSVRLTIKLIRVNIIQMNRKSLSKESSLLSISISMPTAPPFPLQPLHKIKRLKTKTS